VFYSEEQGNDIASAVQAHSDSIITRIRSLPMPIAMKPVNAVTVWSETVTDADLSKGKVHLVLTRPMVSVNKAQIVTDVVGATEETATAVEQYLHTMGFEGLVAVDSIKVTIDGVAMTLTKNKHYFGTALEFSKC